MGTTASSSHRAVSDRASRVWSRRALFQGVPLRSRLDGGFWIRVSRQAMACRFEVTLASEDSRWVPAARAALDEVDRIEAVLTVFRDTSVVTALNRRASMQPLEVDNSLFELLAQCARLHRETDGAFDITSTPLSRCWGFLQREGRVPLLAAIEAARAKVGLQHVVLDPATRRVSYARDGVELNFGAIGKGYALDRVAAGMRTHGVRHALVSGGRSSLLAIGGRSGGWHVDLVSPRAETPFARVWLRDAALGTSGAGEQFFIADGVRYGHVIDPRTGWPASGVLSASVIASSAATADALSTAFLVGGPELAARYCTTYPDIVALITPEGYDKPLRFGRHPGALVEDA